MIKQTTKTKLIAIVFTLLALIFSNDIFTYSSNPPTGLTGAPGEGNCTSCHTGTVISSGTAWNSITISGMPSSYAPGTNYSLTLNGSSAATAKNGFELVVLNSGNSSTGTLTAGTGTSIFPSGKVYLRQTTATVSSWNFNWTAPAIGTGTVTFYVCFNGSNNNGNDGSGDNIYVKSFTLTEQPSNLPTATITPSATAICIGDTLTLTGGGINSPTGFSWTMAGGTPSIANTQVTKVVYATSGLKTISLTTSNGNGNSSPNSVQILVNSKPTATITAPNTLVCDNDSITLTANSGSGFTYLWSDANQTSRSINVAKAGSYTVRVTSNLGCKTTSSVTVITQRAKPSINLLTSKDTICIGDSILFSAKGKATSYTFYNGPTLLRNNKDSNYYFKSQPGAYNISVVAQDSIYCSNVSNIKVANISTPLPLPNVGCGNKTLTSVDFSWGALKGAIGYEISLDSGSHWNSPSGSTGLSHSITGLPINGIAKIWVRAIDNNICGPGPVSVATCQAANCPRLPITIIADTKACTSDSGKAAITLSAPNDGKVYTVFVNNLPAAKPGKYTFKFGPQAGNYNVNLKVIDSSSLSCSFDTTIQFTNYDSPTGPILVTSSNPSGVYCHYDSIINLKVRKLIGTDSVIFSNLSLTTFLETPIKSTTSDTTLTANTNLFLVGDNVISIRLKNNFSGCSKRDMVLIKKVARLGADFNVTMGSPAGNVQFTQTNQDPSNNRFWYFGDGGKDSLVKTTSHQYTSNGTFYPSLIVKDINGCYDTAWKAITISKVGINEMSKSDVKIYPVPAHNTLHVELLNGDKGEYLISDMLGKTVLNGSFTNNTFEIAIEGLSKGSYLINIKTENESMLRKMMVE
jgi:PKD repeat protein